VIVTFWFGESCGSAVPEEAEGADEPEADVLVAVELADEHAAAARGKTTASAMPANRQGLFIHVLLME
jgi:hypothetical protein